MQRVSERSQSFHYSNSNFDILTLQLFDQTLDDLWNEVKKLVSGASSSLKRWDVGKF